MSARKTGLTIHKNLLKKVEIIEIDFLKPPESEKIPKNIDAAYYLIHSMATSSEKFGQLESQAAENFKTCMHQTTVKQVIYLSGISNQSNLSKHLTSRRKVENILKSDHYSLTVLRAGIIVGSGSASFEIIRDIVEKLPVIVAPKWILTKTQPIAIRDVISYLQRVLFHEKCI